MPFPFKIILDTLFVSLQTQIHLHNHLRSAVDELSIATYGASNRPGADQDPPKSSLMIYIIHISLCLSLHLLSSSPQI